MLIYSLLGFLLSILEASGAITPVSVGGDAGQTTIGSLTVAAAIQNFIICIEMFFAAIALRYAFSYEIYREKQRDKGNNFSYFFIFYNFLLYGVNK